MIIDHWPQYHSYLVQTPREQPVICGALNDTSVVGFGQRSLQILPPGTPVLLYRHEIGGNYYILGVLPQRVGDYRHNKPDFLEEGSRTTQRDDEAFTAALQTQGGSLFPDFNAGRPLDSHAGEAGWMNPLGLGLHLGLTQATLRATGLSQLDMFYLDHLVRLHAHNFRLYTGAREQWSGEDEGECSEILRLSPYPWEMKGMPSFGEESAFQTKDAGKRLPDRDEADYEPVEPDQTGIWRYHRFDGYLGNGVAQYITAPAPQNPSPETRSGEGIEHVGLSEIRQHLNGMVELRSTKGIVLEKSAYIPVPRQIRDHADPDGDSSDKGDYKFAGQFGEEGDKHETAEPEPGESKEDQLSFHTQVYDLLSWTRQGYGLLPFHKHSRDWEVPKEGDSRVAPGAGLDPAYTRPPNNEDPLANAPQPYRLKIDHRDQSGEGAGTRFYRGKSIFTLLDNGDVVVENAWGSRIAMQGQDISISCSGDLKLLPGRNLVALAPGDAVVRGGDNIELSSSRHDVRIKAQENFQVLAGNDSDDQGGETTGRGGIVLESRGESPVPDDASEITGVQIKSKEGPLNAYGKGVYVRSTDSRDVVLDADGGEGSVQTYCNQKIDFVGQNRTTVFGSDPETGEEQESYEYADSNVWIQGQERAGYIAADQLLAESDLLMQGEILTQRIRAKSGGQPGDGGSGNTNFELQARSQSVIDSGTSQLRDFGLDLSKQALNRPNSQPNQPYFTSNDRKGPGIKDSIEKLSFRFRPDSDYRVPLILVEQRWQQFLRLFNTGGESWPEPPVTTPENDLHGPYPGYKPWNKDTGGWIEINPSLWDKEKGDLEGPFEDAKFGETSANKPLSEAYLVNSS